jgi:TonB family protein
MMKPFLAAATVLAISSTAFAGPRLTEAPALPSADRIAPWIRDRVGLTAKAELQVCAARDGHVTSVKLVRGSGYDAFDRAVMTDIRDWQYSADSIPKCTLVRISYLAER